MSTADLSPVSALSASAVPPEPAHPTPPSCVGLSTASVWDDAASLRGEFFSADRLIDHAMEIARAHGEPTLSVAAGPLRKRFGAARTQIREAYAGLTLQAATPHDPSPAEEWLLDNSHVVEDQLREIEEDLPAGYLGKLPRLAWGPMAGYPRAYALCLDYLRHTDARIEQGTLVPYVIAYQRVWALTIGELWAVPIMLRIGLCLSVGELADSEANSTDRTRADALAKRLLAQRHDAVDLPAALEHTSRQPITAPFLVQLIRRLRDHESGAVSDWINAQSARLGQSPEDLTRQQNLRQAADQVSVGNAITSMRAIGALDWNKFFERTSLVEEILDTDPSGTYAKTDALSRDRYRHAIEDLAWRSEFDERAVARSAIELAAAAAEKTPGDPGTQHVGYYLVDAGRREFEARIGYRAPFAERALNWLQRHPTSVYLGAVAGLTLLILELALAGVKSATLGPAALVGLGLLLVIPASEVALTLLNSVVTSLLPPRLLAKLDFHAGIPDEHATLVVVPSMLDSEQGIKKLLEDLEIRSLANTDANLTFALLTDFTDHQAADHEADPKRLAQARDGIAELNRRHCGGLPNRYFLLHRRRRHNPVQGTWMGWERKRGKLDELNRLLRGATDTSFVVVTASSAQLRRIRYVITLDADTQLPREVARKLVATIAHPLNRPQFDPASGRVVRGYGIIQPRVGTRPVSSRQSRFAKIAAGQAGIDPYTTAVSDVYQDLFSEGSYIGKGIYDVDAFQAALKDRVPDDALLSHDLFEGVHARTALATDIEVLDDQPASYAVHAGRQHRWVRGDWQLLPWLLPSPPCKAGRQPNQLPVIARWRFSDNLRRSLVAPTLVALLIAGWFTLPVIAALATIAFVGVVGAPLYGWLGMALAQERTERSPSLLGTLRGDLATNLQRTLLGLVFLLDQSISMADATARTLHRMFVSRKNLLEWTTMNQAERKVSGHSERRRLLASAGCSGLLLVGLAGLNPSTLPFAAPVLALWGLAPLVAWWVSRPLPARDPAAPLTPDDRRMLRLVARKTWGFFETFVTEAENWLPPDNFQEVPRPVVAHRTSPTNIGLYLLSTVAARDFGFITLGTVSDRLDGTLSTMELLEKREGHILNWYETTSLKPLEPQYVSTVDSGNLVAYLWTIREACPELADQPIVGEPTLCAAEDALGLFDAEQQAPGATRAGAADRVGLAEALVASQSRMGDLPGAAAALDVLVEKVARIHRTARLASGAASLAWLDRTEAGLRGAVEELDALAPWARHLNAVPQALGAEPLAAAWAAVRQRLSAARSAKAIASMAPEGLAAIETLGQVAAGSSQLSAADRDSVATHLSQLRLKVERSREACEALIARLAKLGARARVLADAMNFRFLYDEDRALFAIGYNVGSSRLDTSYYDLLASEARLASLVAIAKGDAPVEHWFRMGRPRAELESGRVLLSWSGSMFEYLMPLLVLKRPESTLLDETMLAAVGRQRAYGKQRNVPWGVSEAAYNTMDLSMTYQYRAFGVPGLGLKAGLGDDLVVAPYATVLASMIRPDQAAENLRALEKAKLLGPYGFYESIDYTPSHLPPGKHSVVVKCFMAHHQGMSLVALDNVLNSGPMQRRFHHDARVRATDLLLEERIPADAPLLEPRAQQLPATSATEPELEVVEHVGLAAEPLRLHVLGHGDLSTVVSATGTGLTTWKGLDLYRFREDSVDPSGLFIYLRDLDDQQCWSAGYEPMRRTPKSYDAAFSADRVEIRRRDGDLETLMEIVVSPEHPAEVRRITITNHGAQARQLELTTFTEIVLAPRAADLAHRAFSSMFLQTEAVAEHGAVLARRRPRSPEEPESFLIQVLAPEEGQWEGTQLETSRARFIGRGNDVRNPLALRGSEPLSGSTGDVLDPIIALRRTVRIEPGKQARICLTTALATSRPAALELAGVFGSPQAITRTFELGWADARVELRHLGISGAQAERAQKLLSLLLLPRPALRAALTPAQVHGRTRDALWSQGVSGDLPLLVLRVDEPEFASLAGELLTAHEFWRLNGISVDLVFLNSEPGSYEQPLQNQALALVESSPAHAHQDQRGGVYVRRSELLSPEARSLLLGAARVVLSASDGSLGRQLRAAWNVERPAPVLLEPKKALEPRGEVSTPKKEPLCFDNGLGGFSEDGREYVMTIGPGSIPPAPWCNVIANPNFGCVISERGAGFTWASNSQSHRLTPWSNDAVSDPVCEAIYLRDDETGESWSATPAPAGGKAAYVVRHGQGYTRFEHARGGVEHALTVFVSAKDPVKLSRLHLVNRGPGTRVISVYGYAEWVLGSVRDRSRLTVVTELDATSGVIFAQNPASVFPERRSFFTASQKPVSSTADRDEFFGAHGSRERPGAFDCGKLSGRAGGGLDPCAALQVQVVLGPGQATDVTFALGEGADANEARELATAYQQAARVDAELEGAVSGWNRTLAAVTVKTPNKALDLMVNRWLLYQALGARIWARSGFYQSGGAWGFRDQLQDCMALVHSEPGLAREHILRSAARQFVEGDVQHWWHPESGEGIRTRCSDDMLFLPYVTAHYVHATGDRSILDVQVRSLEAPTLEPGEQDSFAAPPATRTTQSLYDHCLRAIANGLTVGPRGLPLMRGGDWNDGMNRVGKNEVGESVWLGWFLIRVLRDFRPIAIARGDEAHAKKYLTEIARITAAIEHSAWDGEWYQRASFDDGTLLGSKDSAECQIDAIAQSWAVIAGTGDRKRAEQAMRSSNRMLFKQDDGMMLLFTPPFEEGAHDPGYIAAYPPGVRENGGQYTHGVLWSVLANALLGDGDCAMQMLTALNPVSHAASAEGVARYAVEPYVVAADVYAVKGAVGRGGWTWYTGSASWMYRIALEHLLGVQLRDGKLMFAPVIPRDWKRYEIDYRCAGGRFHIVIENPHGLSCGSCEVELDGQRLADGVIPLDGEPRDHQVRVVIAAPSGSGPPNCAVHAVGGPLSL